MDDDASNFLQEHSVTTRNKEKIKQYLADDVLLKLVCAKSILKSQGETYDRAIVKLPDVEFANGLTLVALSRARTVEGMIIQDVSHDVLVNKFNQNHSNEVQDAYADISQFIKSQPKYLYL